MNSLAGEVKKPLQFPAKRGPGSWLAWLTRPSPEVHDPYLRRQARLLAGVLLAMIPLTVLTSAIPFVMGTGGITVLLIVPAGVFLLSLAYLLSRTRHHLWGGLLLVGTLTVGGMAGTGLAPDDNIVAAGFGLLSILTADLFTSRLVTAIVAVANISGLLGILLLTPDPSTSAQLAATLMLTCMVTALAIIHGIVCTQEEQGRRYFQAESEERHRLLKETTFAGYYIRDGEEIVRASPSLETRLGYPQGKMVGLNEKAIFADTYTHRQHTSTTSGQAYERMARCADGTLFEVEVKYVDHEFQERPVQVVALHDITEQKALDQLKTKFIADVTHELRTPVTTLGLYMKLLETAPGEKHGEYLKVLRSQVERLAQLSSDVLTISTLDAGALSDAMAPISLNPIVESAVRLYTPVVQAAGLTLSFAPDDALSPVRGNPSELELVIGSMIKNAITFTMQGSICITTRCNESGAESIIEVTDTGKGIDAADLPYIFDRFYRGHRESQTSTPGAGLGLTLVRQIVENHRGHVEVESQPGEGSTFRVILPAASGD